MSDARAIVDTIRTAAGADPDGARTRLQLASAALDSLDEGQRSKLAVALCMARTLLADELAPWCRDLLAEVGALEGEDPNADAEGMLWLDLALVRTLTRLNSDAAGGVRETRERAHEDGRWKLWSDPTLPVGLVNLAGGLWCAIVAERWQRAVKTPAAVVHGIASPLVHLTTGARLAESPTGSLEVRGAAGQRLAAIFPRNDVPTVHPEVMRRGHARFGSVAGKRIFRLFAHEAHGAEIRGALRPESLVIAGGLSGLALMLGEDPAKATGDLRALLDFGRALDLSFDGLEVNGLWTWNMTQANAPGKRRELEVNLNPRVFLSGAAETLKATGDTRQARRARLLVPVLRSEPPYRVPKRSEWGQAWAAADVALLRIVEHKTALANGGVRFDAAIWRELVESVGLDRSRGAGVRSLLLEGDGLNPPLLIDTGGDRFDLADVHGVERAFIVSTVGRARPKP